MNRRKHFLVEKKLQIKFAVMIAIILLGLIIITQIYSYLIIRSIFPEIFSISIGRQLKQLYFMFFLSGIIYMFIITMISIYLSHKIAGPIYRIKKQLKTIVETKDYDKKIVIRKNDALHDLVEIINMLITKLKSTV